MHRIFVGFLAAIFPIFSYANEIYFIATEDNELSKPENWKNGTLPGSNDVAVIDFSRYQGSSLNLADSLFFQGMILTNFTATTLTRTDTQALTLGKDGITIFTNGVPTLSITLPVHLAATQTWEMAKSALVFTGDGKPVGTTPWTIRNANSGRYRHAFQYDGKLSFVSLSSAHRFEEAKRWANELSLHSANSARMELTFTNACTLTDLVASGRLDINGLHMLLTSGGGLSFSDAEIFTFTNGQFTIDHGYAEQNGGTLSGNNIQIGYANYKSRYIINSGTLRCSSLLLGNGGSSDKAEVKFLLKNGSVHVNKINVDWRGSNERATKEMFIEDGDLSIPESRDSQYGIHFAVNENWQNVSDPRAASAFYVQSGGTVHTPRLTFGHKRDNSYLHHVPVQSADVLIKLDNGRLELGSGGIHTMETWNEGALPESRSTYRIALSGGTLAARASWSSALTLDIDSGTNSLTLDTADHTISLLAPIRGKGNIEKIGSGTLSLSDATDFTGALNIREGAVSLSVPDTIPAETFCTQWRAESLLSTFNINQSVPYWQDDHSQAIATNRWGGRTFTPPTLRANLFNGLPGLEFSNSGMVITTNDNPIAGQTNWSAVVVFCTANNGSASGTGNDWYQGAGIVGCEHASIVEDWGMAISSSAHLFGGFGTRGSIDRSLRAPTPFTVNDSYPHVAIMTMEGTNVTINVDGYSDTFAIPISKPQARYKEHAFIGFFDLASPKYFNGAIAELRLYGGHALSPSEQNQLGKTLAAKYGASKAIFSATENKGEIPPQVKTVPIQTIPPSVVWDAASLTNTHVSGEAVPEWQSTDGTKSANLQNVTRMDSGELIGGRIAPTFTPDGINGNPALTFNGINQALGISETDSPLSGATNFSVAIVFQTDSQGMSNADDQHWYTGIGLLDCERPSRNRGDWGIALATRCRPMAGIGLTTEYDNTLHAKPFCLNDGKPHSLIFVCDQTEKKIRLMVDGVTSVKAITGATAPFTPTRILIGQINANGNSSFAGKIATIELYGERALTIEEMTTRHTAFAHQYGITSWETDPTYETEKYGLASRAIHINPGASLILPKTPTNLPSFRLAAGQSLSGEGSVIGTLGLASGTLLPLDSTLPELDELRLDDQTGVEISSTLTEPIQVEEITLLGENRIHFNGGTSPARLPFLRATETVVKADDQKWVVTGISAKTKIEYDKGQKLFTLVTAKGCILILR